MQLHLLVLLLAICTSLARDNSAAGAAESAPSSARGNAQEHFDHCIIGAGPGGVQLGFFLQQSNRSYIVLERAAQAAAFFAEYPRHRNLISINKKSTPRHGQHPDFRMRHDWNSLLSTTTTTLAASTTGAHDDDEVAAAISNADLRAHSLASENPGLLFGNWSDEYYPSADTLVTYVNNFATSQGVNIRYNTLVEDVRRDVSWEQQNAHGPRSHLESHRFVLQLRNVSAQAQAQAADSTNVSCHHVVVATGLAATYSPPNMRKKGRAPNSITSESETNASSASREEPLVYGYEEVPLEPDFYRNKDVLILGKGNAAFELANSISSASATTVIVSRSQLRLSYMTHYPGDVRAVNTRLLDQYQLKSLDQIIDIPSRSMDFGDPLAGFHFSRHSDGRVRVQISPQRMGMDIDALEKAVANGRSVPCNRKRRCLLFDVVVRCLGWRFDVSPFGTPDDGRSGRLAVPVKSSESVDTCATESLVPVSPEVYGKNRKYPATTSWYESVNEANVHVAGTLMHLHDFRKAAGGFVHGYRYLVRALYHHIERDFYDLPWPTIVETNCSPQSLASLILRRINSASGLYQMFSILSDVVVLDRNTGACMVLEEVPTAPLVGRNVAPDSHAIKLLDGALNQQRVDDAAPGAERVYSKGYAHSEFEYITVFFTYGEDYTGCKVLDPAHRKGHFNDFLHPRLYYYRQSRKSLAESLASDATGGVASEAGSFFEARARHEMKENLDTDWTDPVDHVQPLQNFLSSLDFFHGEESSV